MNTIRIFSLFTLLGLATSQAVAMDDIQEHLKDAGLIGKITSKDQIPATWSESAKKAVQSALSTGQSIVAPAVNHPWYTTGVVAIVGGSYIVYKNGTIESITKFAKKYKKTTLGILGTTALVGSAYAANQYGYLETVKGYMPNMPKVSMPSMPSMETVKGYMPSFSMPSKTLGITAGIGATLGLGYLAVNQFNNKESIENAPANEKKTPNIAKPNLKSTSTSSKPTTTKTEPKKEETKKGWLNGLLGSSVDKKKASEEIINGITAARNHNGGLTSEQALEKAKVFNNEGLNKDIKALYSTIQPVNNVKRATKIEEQKKANTAHFNNIVNKLKAALNQ